MKTKSIKRLQLKKTAVAELNEQSAAIVKGGFTTTSLITFGCNSFVAGEDYVICGGAQK
ncbi:class I lanthipeptide [Flavobacteriaceae bacterium M23B6Z8]